MKKILSVILAGALSLTLTACENTDEKSSGSSNNSSSENSTSSAETEKAADKTKKLLEALTFPEMIEAKSDFIDVNFGINVEDLADYSVYICPSGAMPDEFGIFTATSAEKAAAVKEKVEERIKYQTETYTTYTPDEVYKLEGSVCELSGNTVVYAICEDGAKAKEILM